MKKQIKRTLNEDDLVSAIYGVKKGTLDWYIVRGMSVKPRDVAAYRRQFKSFLAQSSVSMEEVSKRVFEYGVDETFYLAYGIGLLEFDKPVNLDGWGEEWL
jgi:hypothetical protein